MEKQIKLQVPMDKKVHERLKGKADQLGFDSVQAYVRFWAAAEVRVPDRNSLGLSPATTQAVAYLELLLANAKSEPASMADALEYVVKELRRIKGKKYLESILY